MPRVHSVKKARKDNPVVKAGESYYWWKFRFGGKRYSVTRPKRWQLTQSYFLGQVWQIEDELPDTIDEAGVDELVEQLNELLYECQDSLDNMPDHLQDTSDSGILLSDRIDSLECWISECDGIDWDDMSNEEAATLIQETNPGF